jgi:hypothetical protein
VTGNTQDVPDKPKLDLSIAQIGAAVLVTVTTTVGGSFLGTAGTLVSATVMSIVSTVAGALYKHGLTIIPATMKNGRVFPAHRVWHMPKFSPQLMITVGALAAAVFFGVMTLVTASEAAAGKPVSAIVKGEPGHGTSLGGGSEGTLSPEPSTSPDPSQSPAPSTPLPSLPVPSQAPSELPTQIPSSIPPAPVPTEVPTQLPLPPEPTPEPS